MCGDPINEEAQKEFDPVSRCTVSHGIATRYFGLPGEILAEIQKAGFHILHWEISKAEDEKGPYELLVETVKD